MKKSKFTFIIIFITATILATISLQVYWNIKNYAENKTRVVNEIQTAFDKSVEKYYVEESKKSTVAYFAKNGTKLNVDDIEFESIITKFDKKNTSNKNKVQLKKSSKKAPINKAIVSNLQFIESNSRDTNSNNNLQNIHPNSIKSIEIKTAQEPKYKVFRGKKAIDSVNALNSVAEKMVFSITTSNDSINFKSLTKFFDQELSRKKIDIEYGITHLKEEKNIGSVKTTKKAILNLKTESKSNYLSNREKLKLQFSDPTRLILYRSVTGIILSLMLSLSIIACMVYLFKIINKQKKIDAIKNDLIGNITHEFKTPITTISSAIEGIKNFSAHNDTEKTNRYLTISQQQIKKLSHMVEKLLETASLETDALALKKEKVDLIFMLKTNIEKHKMFCIYKNFNFYYNTEKVIVAIDLFHFENVISNLLDNAIKYGGNTINVALKIADNKIAIDFIDSGLGIAKEHHNKVFEQFYRIPKGNIHDVKGFGIGLYYAKKIMEKHGGNLIIIPTLANTHFKITLPYEQN